MNLTKKITLILDLEIKNEVRTAGYSKYVFLKVSVNNGLRNRTCSNLGA